MPLYSNKIVSIKRRSTSKIKELEQDLLKLKRLLHKTIMDNYIFKVRLISDKCRGKVLPNVLLKLKKKAINKLEYNNIEVTEQISNPEANKRKVVDRRANVLEIPIRQSETTKK